MSDAADTNEPSEGREHIDDIDLIEVVTGDIDSEGNVIVDDSVFVVDAGGTVIAKDETITFETPEGEIVVDETVSVLGDDGELHVIDQDVSVLRPDNAGGLTDEIRGALTAGNLGHLTTLNPDGSPQVSVVWIGVEGDDIVIGHMMGGRKVKNIARDPRVALTVETEGANPVGMANYLIVYGTARLVEGGAPELLQRLAGVYVGEGVKFPPFEDPPPGHVIHITPERFGGVGPWS